MTLTVHPRDVMKSMSLFDNGRCGNMHNLLVIGSRCMAVRLRKSLKGLASGLRRAGINPRKDCSRFLSTLVVSPVSLQPRILFTQNPRLARINSQQHAVSQVFYSPCRVLLHTLHDWYVEDLPLLLMRLFLIASV